MNVHVDPAPAALPAAMPDWLARADARGWDWARKAWNRAASQPGAWFDHVKAERVVAAWPHWIHLTDDRFAGRPFKLFLWEEIIVRMLVGWKIPIEVQDDDTSVPTIYHVRLFRELRLWVPRKNGKTEFLAGLFKLFFQHDPVVGGQGYVFAKDEKQAAIAFEKIKAMIGYDAGTAGSAEVYKKTIYLPRSRSLAELLPGRADGKHGRSPTVTLGDEMHEWITRDMETTLRQGSGVRLQPIGLFASTSGLKTNLTGTEIYNECLAILDGTIDRPSVLVVIFAAEEDDDIYAETTWRKANPSYPVTPTLQFMRDEAALARGNPRREATFRCYHLNQWIDSDVRWLPRKQWLLCSGDGDWKTRGARMNGRRCVGAFDMSATQDITCVLWRFSDEELIAADDTSVRQTSSLACRFFIPEETLAMRAERDKHTPWRQWVDQGAIEILPGGAIDPVFITKAVLEGLSDYNVDRIGYDDWNAAGVVADLQRAGVDPDKLIKIPQQIRSLCAGSKHFERRVFNGWLDHGGHPVLAWMAGHVVLRFDENLNYAPAKKRSREKIDGIVSAVMAEALMIAPPEDDRSVYEDHGILEISV